MSAWWHGFVSGVGLYFGVEVLVGFVAVVARRRRKATDEQRRLKALVAHAIAMVHPTPWTCMACPAAGQRSYQAAEHSAACRGAIKFGPVVDRTAPQPPTKDSMTWST